MMTVGDACNIVANLAEKRNLGVLELLNEYCHGQNEDKFNPDFGLVENQACRTFINAGAEMFSETV